MPLSKIPIKETIKLFNNYYQYKIIIVTALASWFRGANFLKIEEKLSDPNCLKDFAYARLSQIHSEGGLNFSKDVFNILSKMSDYKIRVEHPYLSIYSNSESDIIQLASVNPTQVKSIHKPQVQLDQNVIITKNIDFKYKVTIGNTTQSYDSFVKWASENQKIKISNSVKKRLLKPRAYQGGYFYAKDEKSLTMVKMFFGNCIVKIENVVKR